MSTPTDIEIIEAYREALVQIATPYSTGTGCYLSGYGLVVTNEHIVRDNKEVVLMGRSLPKQIGRVVFLDTNHDLAFVRPTDSSAMSSSVQLASASVYVGEKVIAIGHPFGLELTVTKGIVSSLRHELAGVNFIKHDATLQPGNSGGPLVNIEGAVVGINTFLIKRGENTAYALPSTKLLASLQAYEQSGADIAVVCTSCNSVTPDNGASTLYCSSCGAEVTSIRQIRDFEPRGAQRTIEQMLHQLGYSVDLCRTGPSKWSIKKGSAKISISYHEKTGLIVGDAYLCQLPKEGVIDLYQYLLQQNYTLDSLTFSVKEDDVIISLLIYDQYFNRDTAAPLFEQLFQSADHYDNILVEKFAARWYSET